MKDLMIPTGTEIEQKVSRFVKEAKGLVISDDVNYSGAAELLRQEKTLYKYVENFYQPTKDALNKAKSELMKAIKLHTAPLSEAEKIIKGKMTAYHEQKERERLEEQKKLQEKLRKEEEERRLNEAIETGDESVLEKPMIVPTIKIEKTAEVKGISYQDIVRFEIVDPKQVPFPEYWRIDEDKIGKQARSAKGKIKIPGVKIWTEQIVKARGH